MVCQKLESLRPVQQKIKLSSPNKEPQFCDFFSLACNFFYKNLKVCDFVALVCYFLAHKFTILWHFFTSLWRCEFLSDIVFILFVTRLWLFITKIYSFVTCFHYVVIFYHISLNFCDFFTLICDFLSHKFKVLWLFFY